MLLSLLELAWRPAAAMVARTHAQVAHDGTVALLRRADGSRPLSSLATLVNQLTLPDRPTLVGGVWLPHPVILAAGMVKGDGFAGESAALAAQRDDRNIVPGWRSMPALLGPVEFGSYTRYPRVGNPGRVLWREARARTMQNRVGLRNPGASAAAAHLRAHAGWLPATWGLNLAVSPGVAELERARQEITEAAEIFGEAFGDSEHGPAWLTLNLSCPNTEDDPHGTQSADLAHALSAALVATSPVPVWVKVGPDLSDAQLAALVGAFTESGVSAVVATNTWAQPLPPGDRQAGASGSRLRPLALHTVTRLARLIAAAGAAIDIVGCGGILEGAHLRSFRTAGARAVMVYSALVFRGPLAAALILREADRGDGHG